MSRETNRLLGIIDSTNESITHYQRQIADDNAEINRLKLEVSQAREEYKDAARKTKNDLDGCVDEATVKAMQLSTLNHSFTVGSGLSAGFEALSGIAELMKADPALIEGLKTAGLIGEGLSGNWFAPIIGGLVEGGDLVAPASKTTENILKAAGKAASKAGKISGFGSLVGGVADASGTYFERKEVYGEQAATQDALVHGAFTTVGGFGGAVAGAYIGTLIGTAAAPGVGTIAGAIVGLIVGVAIPAVGNGFYDNTVKRDQGDGLWDHIRNNVW